MKKNHLLLRILQGALIGLGAVLPGISGGVLSVIFGVYKPVMELLANPLQNYKTHVPKLFPVIFGFILGFLGVANLLTIVLEKYPAPSVCLFIGLITGMLPSLFQEANEKGCEKGVYTSLFAAMGIVFALLIGLNASSVQITPSFSWYLFCGFCLALSFIAPGMSFSTLLMPLGLYTPFVDGIGHLSTNVLLPGGIGIILAFACLPRFINSLFAHHYAKTFHAIIGIIIAATIMILPLDSFFLSARSCLINSFFLCAGVVCALLLDKFNKKLCPQT